MQNAKANSARWAAIVKLSADSPEMVQYLLGSYQEQKSFEAWKYFCMKNHAKVIKIFYIPKYAYHRIADRDLMIE